MSALPDPILLAVTRHGPNGIPGLRAHPDDRSSAHRQLLYWLDYGRALEHAGLDGIWFLDHPIALGDDAPLSDASYLVPALAAATERLGFVVTQPVNWQQPYPIARKLSTLDHLTGGRVGFSIDSKASDQVDGAFGQSTPRSPAELRERASEFLDVLYKLFETSWDEDALVADKARRIFNEPDRIHDIGHAGRFFSVPGVHLVDPSPQRTPVIAFEGTAATLDKDLVAAHGELVLLREYDRETARSVIAAIHDDAQRSGRTDRVRFLLDVAPVVAGTDAAAVESYRAIARQSGGVLREDVDATTLLADFRDGRSPVLVGGHEFVVREITALLAITGADGLGVRSLVEPASLQEFAARIAPRFRTVPTPEARTLRARIGGAGPRLVAGHPGLAVRRGADKSVHSLAK